jgi:protein-S-isoprenylcysteine O-methyltransferase Ste14
MCDSVPAQVPKWSGPLLWIVGALVVHVALPFAISGLTVRFGWESGSPNVWNWIGLIPVAAGLAMIAWGASLHFVSTEHGWRMETTPRYLIERGPYKFSRNPMYVLELAMWFGWAVFYGSLTVLIAFFLWWISFYFLVRYEERQLETRFGEEYMNYKRSVPRWFKI